MSGFPFVLMYHSVGQILDDPHQLTVTADRLGAQLSVLRALGLRGASLRDLPEAGRRGVGLTFDDGYADFVETAIPVLRAHGATATVFALGGRLGGDNGWDAEGERKRLMTADELRAAESEGMEVASHGMAHQRLTGLGRAALRDEVAGSREVLSDILARPVEGFAYPYGALGPREVDAVVGAGYRYGAAVSLAGTGVRPSAHALPRSYAGQRDAGLRLLAKRLRHTGRVVLAR